MSKQKITFPDNLYEALLIDEKDITANVAERWRSLKYVISHLGDKEEDVICLIYENDTSIAEAAKMMGISQYQLKGIHYEALRKLQEPERMGVILHGIKPYAEREFQERLQKMTAQMLFAYGINDYTHLIPLTELDIALRTYNCLYRAGVRTLKDILDLGDEGLAKVKDLGNKSTQDVLDALEKLKKNKPM